MIRKRYEVGRNNGVPIEDIAHYEVGGALAILVNTAPAAFWIMFFVYSCPGLLEDLREEVDEIITTDKDDPGNVTRSLDIPA